MAEASLKLGGDWATKEGSLLGFNDQNGNYKPIPFDFTRATTATRVNRNGLIEEVQSGVPRIDFTGDGSLLLEPQRTNAISDSNDFGATNWTSSLANVTSNEAISPEGIENASKFITTASTGNHQIDATNCTISSGAVTGSVFAKKGDNISWLRLRLSGTSSPPRAWFDLENGVVGNVDATGSATIEDYGNGWYRCSLTEAGNTAAGSGGRLQIFLNENNSQTSFTANGDEYHYIYGAQLEQGSYATSYIPTEGSAVTRNVDVCEKTGFQGVSMNATQGTILMHIDNPYALGGNNDFHMFRATGSSGINDGWLFRCNLGTTIDLLERVGGSTGAQVSSLATKDQINKIAWSFNASTFLISANGVTKSYTGTYNGTQIDIDEFNTSGSNLQGLEIINMQFFETALTQDELNALTTL